MEPWRSSLCRDELETTAINPGVSPLCFDHWLLPSAGAALLMDRPLFADQARTAPTIVWREIERVVWLTDAIRLRLLTLGKQRLLQCSKIKGL